MALMVDRAEAAGGLSGGHCGEPALLAMKIDRRANVDVADPVAIGQAELFVVAQEWQDSLDPTSDHRPLAGVDESHPPRLGRGVVHFHAVVLHVERDV